MTGLSSSTGVPNRRGAGWGGSDSATTEAWYPLTLESSFRERIWGERDLSFLYASRPAEPAIVGEVWLTADDNRITNGRWAGKTLGELCRLHGAELLGRAGTDPSLFPLLIKFIFTSDKLSVQVHPSDEYARQNEGCAGKTEMWHILRAEPGARLSVGFRQDLREPDARTLREAVESGAIEELLNSMEGRPGDTFFVPCGTVHAIGAGLVLCEIQQNSDVTYRLYDYNRTGADGRPRALHLDKAFDVLKWRTNGGHTTPLAHRGRQDARQLLAACPYFAAEKLELDTPGVYNPEGRMEVWIGLDGCAEIESSSRRSTICQGEAVVIPAPLRAFSINPVSSFTCLRTYCPELEADIIAPLRAQGASDEELRGVCFPGDAE